MKIITIKISSDQYTAIAMNASTASELIHSKTKADKNKPDPDNDERIKVWFKSHMPLLIITEADKKYTLTRIEREHYPQNNP